MNILEKIFKRKVNYQRENAKAIRAKLNENQDAVFKAVKELARPVNGRQVARHLNWDSASVTPRLAELVKKGRLIVAFPQKGLDGIWRKYYVVVKDKKF